MTLPFSKINFPLYAVAPLSCNHVVVSGGGGSANTGVFNGFAICEIGYEKNGYVAYEIQRQKTGSSSIMNCAITSFNKKIFLAAGKDADCYIYQFKLEPQVNQQPPAPNPENAAAGAENELRQRTTANGRIPNLDERESPATTDADDSIVKDLVFDIQIVQSVQTDFSSVDPCQNVVTFSQDARIVLTGGADGIIRVWTFPEMKQRSAITASKKEISDLDVTSDRKYVSCITKDGKCKIWTLSDGKLKCGLDFPPEDEGKFLYKRCKFGLVEDKRNTYRLFVILNPINYKQNKSYIQHWTGPTFSLTKVVPAGEALSALAVSRCGRYIAVGSMTTGDVDIYIGFSLQKVKHIEKAHKTFVTGLAFLPPVQPNEESVLADCDAAVVSISIDNQIHVHHIERTTGISMWLAVVLIILVLLATFMTCSYIDL